MSAFGGKADAPKNRTQEAVRAAFELGMAAAEHRLFDSYEEYFRAGIASEQWRAEGLPAARAFQGQRTRTAILNTAKELYAKDPALIRNDTKTAKAIPCLELPELQKGGGRQLGIDAHKASSRIAKMPPVSKAGLTIYLGRVLINRDW